MYIYTDNIWIQVPVGKIKVKSYRCIPFLKFWIDEYTKLSPGCSPFCHFDKENISFNHFNFNDFWLFGRTIALQHVMFGFITGYFMYKLCRNGLPKWQVGIYSSVFDNEKSFRRTPPGWRLFRVLLLTP